MKSSVATLGMLAGLALVVGLTGCASNRAVYLTGPGSDRPEGRGETTLGLDYRDFEFAAEQAVDSFVRSRYARKPGTLEPWVMAISRVINDTALDIDTDQLVKKIRIDLLNSGRVVVTTAIGADGAEDSMTEQVRDLREDEEFDQETIPETGTLVAPELSLSGKIIQRANPVGKEQQVDYYFQLTVTEIETGLAYWEWEEVIVKLGSDDRFSWE